MVLCVDENESVARQLRRGEEVRAQNEEVVRSGIGEKEEERPTNFDESLAKNRYRVRTRTQKETDDVVLIKRVEMDDDARESCQRALLQPMTLLGVEARYVQRRVRQKDASTLFAPDY